VRYNKMISKAGLAVTLLTLAAAQVIGWRWGRSADLTTTAATTQIGAAAPGFGGYQIVKRLAAPYAPLGGGRAPYPRLVFEDNQGRFWIAHIRPGGLVQLFDEDTGRWDLFSAFRQSDSERIHHHGDALLPENIAHICQSKDGIMWFSDKYAPQVLLTPQKDRLFLTSFDGKQWRSFPFAATSNGSIGLIQGTDGQVWFWAMDELRHWDGGRWSEPTRISDELKDPAPQVPPSLAGTTEGQEIQKRYRTRYEIIEAIQDRKGYLWLSTHSGILTHNPRTSEFTKLRDLSDGRASSIYEDHQGRIWFNEGFVATVYDRSKGTVTRYNPLDHIVKRADAPDGDSMIAGICQDRRGRMIFAVWAGLVILSEIDNSWGFAATAGLGLDVEDVTNELESIVEDSKGRIWVPGFTGIAILDQSRDPARITDSWKKF
jgi:Two component regulator propeller